MAKPKGALYEVLLGALLHDIGKAQQRASPNPRSKRHQEFGEEWLANLYPVELREALKPARPFVLRHHALKRQDPKYDRLDALSHERSDLLIVWEADNLAAGSERATKEEDPDAETDSQFQPDLPLFNILQRIENLRTPLTPQQKLGAFPPMSLHDAAELSRRYYPRPFHWDAPLRVSKEQYETLLKGLAAYLNTGLGPEETPEAPPANEPEGHRPPPFHQATDPIQYLLNALEQFLASVPSETRFSPGKPETLPDVSLFDHLKTTAAIASAMAQYFLHQGISLGQLSPDQVADRTEPRYLLVAGDLSGVQSFLYTITYRAALKGLRARSLYLVLLTEHVVQQILQALGLSRANVIYSGGGGFYLLTANTEKTRQTLHEIQTQMNEWLFQEHEGRLFLALAWVPLNGHSFLPTASDYPKLAEAWGQLQEQLGQQKAHRFHDLLTPEFFQPQDTQNRRVCAVCQKVAPVDRAQGMRDEETGAEYFLCPTCYALENIGKNLPQTRYILAYARPLDLHRGNLKPAWIRIQNRWYYFFEQLPEALPEPEYWFSVNRYEADGIPLFVANHPGRALDFHEVVARGAGAPLLGTLRADVDNLGQVFARGFPRKEERHLARYATLSRLFTLFFQRMVNAMARGHLPQEAVIPDLHPPGTGQNPRQFAVVYSGGDDLLITGAWHDVATFALELQRAFRKFVGQNPNLTLSAGVVLTDPKHPIYRIAELAGHEEDRAKARGRGQEKNALALFEVVAAWDQWEEQVDTLRTLLTLGTWQGNRFVPLFARSLVYKLLHLLEQARALEEEHQILVIPRVLYVLGRARPRYPREASPQDRARWDEAWQTFAAPAASADPREALNWLRSLKGPLTWLDYLVRGGEAS